MVFCLVQLIAAIKAIVGGKTAIPAPALDGFTAAPFNTKLWHKALQSKRGLEKGSSQGFPIFRKLLFSQFIFTGASGHFILLISRSCFVPRIKVRTCSFLFLFPGFFLFRWQSRRKVDSQSSTLVRPVYHFKGRISFPLTWSKIHTFAIYKNTIWRLRR